MCLRPIFISCLLWRCCLATCTFRFSNPSSYSFFEFREFRPDAFVGLTHYIHVFQDGLFWNSVSLTLKWVVNDGAAAECFRIDSCSAHRVLGYRQGVSRGYPYDSVHADDDVAGLRLVSSGCSSSTPTSV